MPNSADHKEKQVLVAQKQRDLNKKMIEDMQRALLVLAMAAAIDGSPPSFRS